VERRRKSPSRFGEEEKERDEEEKERDEEEKEGDEED